MVLSSLPQHRRQLGAEAAAADQHEPLDALRELVGELQGDPAAETVTDDGRGGMAEHDEQVAQRGGQHAARSSITRSHVRREPPSPWIRRSGSPWPAVVQAMAPSPTLARRSFRKPAEVRPMVVVMKCLPRQCKIC